MYKFPPLFYGWLAISLTFAATHALHAAEFYVSEHGDDQNPGTSSEQPFLTLQHADSAVKPGDTVYVMAGTYRHAPVAPTEEGSSLLKITTSGTADAWITWRNYRNDKPELIATDIWHAINLRASYIILDGLTVTGNNQNVRQSDAEINAQIDPIATNASQKKLDESISPDLGATGKKSAAATPERVRPIQRYAPNPRYNGNGIDADCRQGPAFHHFILRNLVVRDFGTVGIGLNNTDHYLIENCSVYHNGWYSRYGSSGISTLLGQEADDAPGYHGIIRNNKVWNNKCLVRCLSIDLFTDGNGIIIDSPENYAKPILVENNLCFDNGGAGIHVYKNFQARVDIIGNTLWHNQQMWQLYELGCNNSSNVHFLNNIVYADRSRLVTGAADPGVTYDYNLYFGSHRAALMGSHDQIADPLFVLPTTISEMADFHLQPGSPALGSGWHDPALPADNDLDGLARTDSPSRGAYQK